MNGLATAMSSLVVCVGKSAILYFLFGVNSENAFIKWIK